MKDNQEETDQKWEKRMKDFQAETDRKWERRMKDDQAEADRKWERKMKENEDAFDLKWQRKANKYKPVLVGSHAVLFALGIAIGAFLNDQIRGIDKKK